MWKRQYINSGKGKAGISREIAAFLLRDVRVHDDGVEAFGGISNMITGPMGCGKTTFMIQLSASVGSLPGGMTKEEYHTQSVLKPETVIWRGRRYDYWNSLVPWNWKDCYPMSPVYRPVRIHHHAGDTLSFFERFEEPEPIEFNGNGLTLNTYQSAKDVYDNLIPGGINVVYEPNQYFLDDDVVQQITKKTLEDLRLQRLKRSRKKNREDKGEPVEAPSSAFWFELIEYVMKTKKQSEFYSMFIDEAHQVAPEKVPGEMWHLIGWLSNSIIDMRRNNLSLFLTTHDLKLVDYRVVDRMLYFTWMPGSRVYKRLSQINPATPRGLVKGEFIIEGVNPAQFGLGMFNPIPNQPPVVYTEGLKAST
jgi:hypothetical protein